jgi:hypothetical protein
MLGQLPTKRGRPWLATVDFVSRVVIVFSFGQGRLL